MQHILFSVIAERHLFETNALLQPGKRRAAARGEILFQCCRQLADQPQRRLAACQQPRQLRDGLNHKVHQVYENDHNAGGQPIAGQSEVRSNEKHAELRKNARHSADHTHEDLDPPFAELISLQSPVAFGKELIDLLLRLEALNDRESAEAVVQRGGKVLVSLRHTLFSFLQLVSRQKGSDQRQNRNADGDGGHNRGVPQHHGERADECHGFCDQGKLLRKIVRLYAACVVGQSRKIGSRTLVPKG